MLEIRITAPELSEAINNLAKAMTSLAPTTPIGTMTCAVPTNTTSAPVEEAPQQVTPAAVPPTAPAVPTAPPQYTCDMIAKAGATLVEAGKMNELLALLARFGVEAVTSLDPAQYGAFATELRAMGASI